MMALTTRHLDFAFELGEGDFGEQGSNRIDVKGSRASVVVTWNGGLAMAEATAKVYGLPLDVMNKLSILGKPLADARANIITIYAYDEGSAPVDIFRGFINEAWIDGAGSPNVAFVVSAAEGIGSAMKPTETTQYKDPVDLALVVERIAKAAGYGFENSGVSVQVPTVYFHGTALAQLQQAAEWGDFNMQILGGVVCIWPARGTRDGQPTPVNKGTGLVGYPAIADGGVQLVSLFNPLIAIGRRIKVESIFTRANGEWTVSQLQHELDSETVGGKWFTNISGRLFDFKEGGSTDGG